MIAVDSNVLIYRLMKDDASLPVEMKKIVNQAKHIFNENYKKHDKIAIPLPVLVEFANYLRRKIGSQKAAEIIDELIADDKFLIIEAKEEYIVRSVAISEEYGTDFTDSLISTCLFANGIKKILTYDEDFKKFEDIEVIK